jgi:hypothetical protein
VKYFLNSSQDFEKPLMQLDDFEVFQCIWSRGEFTKGNEKEWEKSSDFEENNKNLTVVEELIELANLYPYYKHSM